MCEVIKINTELMRNHEAAEKRAKESRRDITDGVVLAIYDIFIGGEKGYLQAEHRPGRFERE